MNFVITFIENTLKKIDEIICKHSLHSKEVIDLHRFRKKCEY